MKPLFREIFSQVILQALFRLQSSKYFKTTNYCSCFILMSYLYLQLPEVYLLIYRFCKTSNWLDLFEKLYHIPIHIQILDSKGWCIFAFI